MSQLWWICVLVFSAYVLGFLYGRKTGEKLEKKRWENDVLPTVKRLECERDTLWRSAVAKKQKLNRLMKKMGEL